MYMFEEALNIVRRYGIEVFPLHSINPVTRECTCRNQNCSAPGKHPLLRTSWKIIATSNISRIHKWNNSYEHVNFAVATGRKLQHNKMYLVVVDVDKENHDIISKLTETFCYKTGGGGYHYWYWSKTPVSNSVRILPNVDVRGLNGYVIIPPSRHKSGNMYELLPGSTREISELPSFFAELVESKTTTRKKQQRATLSSTQSKKQKPAAGSGVWGCKTVSEIREKIECGDLVPVGARNTVVHKLLSSERAKGEYSRLNIVALANHYNTKSLLVPLEQKELLKIVDSVMKYKAYNNSHERVNELYVKWRVKNGYKTTGEYQKHLQEADDRWFAMLQKTDSGGVSLAELVKHRQEYLEHVLKTKNISQYKPSLLGTKLRELGFVRKKGMKSNKWLISLPSHDILKDTQQLGNISPMPKKQTKAATNPTTSSKPQPKVETLDVAVTVKRHPNEFKYLGSERDEHFKGLLEFMHKLTPEQHQLFQKDKLFWEPEKTQALFDEIKPDDFVGVNHSTYKVLEKGLKTLTLAEIKEYAKAQKANCFYDTVTISLEELSVALGQGFAEILYRDEKPYGIEQKKIVKVQVIDTRTENQNEELKEK